MEAFESDLGLISKMYPDELHVQNDSLIFTVKPNTEYGIQSPLQFDLRVTMTPTMKINLINPKGMDESEIFSFRKLVKSTARELRYSDTDCFLFALFTSVL
jgi:hypothetical protein